MDVSTLSPMRLEFLRRAEWRREEERRSVERDQKQRKDREDRERREDIADDIDMVVSVLATESEIAEFAVTLDTYDAATIEALQENDEALREVREELDRMLELAYVLPDGRRVFKTEDGLRVFDENGVEVTDFDPEEIEDSRPRYEAFLEATKRDQQLVEERNELFEYQSDLDEARERLDDDDLTHEELEELKAALERDKPDAVKRALGEETEPAPVIEGEAEFDPALLSPLRPRPLGP